MFAITRAHRFCPICSVLEQIPVPAPRFAAYLYGIGAISVGRGWRLYQETFAQELVDGAVRFLSATAIILAALYTLLPRIERLGRFAKGLVGGFACGLLAVAALAFPLAVPDGHATDLRAVPLLFAAPTAGIPAALLAVVIAIAGDLTLNGTWDYSHAVTGFISILVPFLVSCMVALSRKDGRANARPFSDLGWLQVAGLALGSVLTALLSEFNIQAFHADHATGSEWIFYLFILPISVFVAGFFLIELAKRREMEKASEAAREQISTISNNIPGVLYRRSVGPSGELLFRYVSNRSVDVLGLSPNAIVSDASIFLSRVHPDDKDLVRRALSIAAEKRDDPIITEYRFLRPDGRAIWLHTHSQVNRAETARIGETVAEGIAFDITDRKEMEILKETAERKERWAAEHDVLTGLRNRYGFSRLATSLDGRPVLILAVNLRRSYLTNELFGSETGDLRIVETSKRLAAVAGARAYIGRIDGDEFLIYTDFEDDVHDPLTYAQTIKHALEQKLVVSGHTVPLEADIGYCTGPFREGEWQDAVSMAIMAVEVARQGQEVSIVAFSPDLKAKRVERHAIDLRIGSAIEQGEIAVFGQPVATITDRRIVGHEALARWVQQDGVCVAPSTFVPRAEATGLWPQLDAHVLRSACRQASLSAAQTWVSVNMSPGWLLIGDLVGEVHTALDASGLNPARLCIELTERAMIGDHVRAARQIGMLRDMGVSVAIDDFGSGYSCLNYLSRLPVSKVKIDKAFVDEIERSQRARDVIENIVMLCGKLHAESIAEGVETEGQFAWLKSIGCTAIQGYLIGKARRDWAEMN